MSEFSRSCRPMLLILGLPPRSEGRLAVAIRVMLAMECWLLIAPTSRHSVCVHRQGELKRGTVGYVCRGPQPATVSFDDRTADRESHAHATGFSGEECVEQPVGVLGG